MLNYGYIILAILLYVMTACQDTRDEPVAPDRIGRADYRRFQNTPAWELAKATEDGDTLRMRKLLQRTPSLLDYQEPHGGMTLLMMTVMNQARPHSFPEKYIYQVSFRDNKVQHRSFRFLLEYGAHVNMVNPVTGETALLLACSSAYYHMQYIEELLAYGADINYIQPRISNIYMEDNKTVLMGAVSSGRLDIVKFLVEHGAKINYTNSYRQTPLSVAMYKSYYDIALYLIKKGANYRAPLGRRCDMLFLYGDTALVYIAEYLRYKVVLQHDTQRRKRKMELVEYLKEQGIDYAKTPIPESVVEDVRKIYPETWREYLKNY